MRITTQFLRAKANGPLHSVEYLDLSVSEIVSIDRLTSCPKLQTLILKSNQIYDVTDLECCSQLWNVDLSNNQITSLDGLSRFVAFGTLNLSNNNITWQDLKKIRNARILDLSLHGNTQLDKDPYYRIHIIDCLPNIWMLDGRMVTSSERLQVKHFFQDSALTDRPVRHKLSRDAFVPSVLQKIEVNGIFGERATHLMTRFPTNGASNIETDKRQLKYLAYKVQEDLILESKYQNRDFQVLKFSRTFLEDVLEVRAADRERCNMLLLLLITSLEFLLPVHLVKETLDTAKLEKVGKIYAMDLFLLPRDARCTVVSVLLSAVKIDKDNNEDGGLYGKLYMCLFYTVSELVKLCHSDGSQKTIQKTKLSSIYKDHKRLLASEVVQLLCIVPAFFDYVTKDVGVKKLVSIATGEINITEDIINISETCKRRGGDERKICEEVADYILQRMHESSSTLSNKQLKIDTSDLILNQTKALPMKSQNTPVNSAEYHLKGKTTPESRPTSVMSTKRQKERDQQQFPHLGELLLLGPQTFGKIISLPQPFLALVSMDAVPVPNGAMVSKLKLSDEHYTYANLSEFKWDAFLGCWKPKGTIGDKYTIQSATTFKSEVEDNSDSNADESFRPCTPEVTSGIETSPLIYSPRKSLTSAPSTPRTSKTQKIARPMSSVLKEKYDLKLTLTTRAKSAGPTYHRGRQSARDVDDMTDDNTSREVPPPTREQSLSRTVSAEYKANGEESKPVVHECLHCALEKAKASEEVADQNEGSKNIDGNQVQNIKDRDKTKLLTQFRTTLPTDKDYVINSFEVIHNASDVNSEPVRQGSANKEEPRKPLITLQVPVDDGAFPNSPRETKLPSKTESSRSIEKLSMNVTTPRPFSAVDAYKYIVLHPRANKIGAHANRKNYYPLRSGSSREKMPPPQRPSSPYYDIQSSAMTKGKFNIKRANDWLAGGRDLYWESLLERPKSAHKPGWKEGLPSTMRRPVSAAARSLSRPRTPAIVTPSSLAYDAMLHGYTSVRDYLDNTNYKSEYEPVYQQLGIPRQLGSSRNKIDKEVSRDMQENSYRRPHTPKKDFTMCRKCYNEKFAAMEMMATDNSFEVTCNC